MREALALLIPACAIGIFLVPRRAGWRRSTILAATLSLCLGIGFSSFVSTALIVGGIAPTATSFVVTDVAIWTAIGVLGWWLKEHGTQSPEPRAQSPEPPVESPEPTVESAEPKAKNRAPHDHFDWIVRAAFGVTATVALVAVIVSSLASPHGDWDAWAIWNQHARFLFRGGGSDAWRAFFAINWSQPDYPLLLPASVARVWSYAGHESTLGPILIAIVFGIASVALVVTALDGRRAWIAGALLLVATTFLTEVPSQSADVPLACFIVATLAVACGDLLRIPDPGSRIPSPESPVPAVVAGATSAMAAWTKNEGLVFALLMLVVAVLVAVRRRDGRPLLWWIAGASPVLIAIAWFKLTLAPSSGLVEGQSPEVFITRLFDLHRHETVTELMAQHAMAWSAPLAGAIFPLVGFAAAWMAVRRGGAVRVMTVVLALMLVSYYLAYVTTPFDISWHVSTSIDRLLVQLWPSLVLAVFLGLRSPVSGPQSPVSKIG
jgi:hypothetical protein